MLFYLLLCFAAHASAQTGLTVNITQGVIQGSNALDGNYYTFYGIHYAGSTSGSNRFKAPSPAPIYPGTFHAVESGVICAQPSPRGFIGVEDCLTLNVFTQNSTTRKPVIVWLNGEEYAKSDPITYSYKGLVEEGLVVVQVNYRLSIFGFLCLRVPEAPGNAGLKDVIQALEWVKENIAAFGGDPDNVVLLGHGSAAAMVDLITLSPRSANLTHKAIALSGSGLAPWAVSYDPIESAKAVGDNLGYNDKTPGEIAVKLAVTGSDILVNSINDFKSNKNNTPLFAPCIEDAKLNGSVITEDPLNIIRSGNFKNIPYIAGYTDREGTLRAEQAAYANWLTQMNANFTEFLQVDLEFKSDVIKSNISKTIREFYFGDRNVDMGTIEDYLDYQGDTLVLVSVIRGALERALKSPDNVRLFEFGFRGSRSEWPYQTIPLKGVKHGGLLNYLFNYDLNDVDVPVSKILVRRFRNFALSGVPTSESNNAAWSPISQDTFNFLTINGGVIDGLTTEFTEQMRTNPHQQRMTFWNDIYSKHHKAHVQVSSVDRVLCAGVIVMLCQLFITLLY